MMRPSAALHHAADRRPRQPEAGREIHVEHRLPILVLHAHRQHVAGDAGIVDEDVDLAHRGLGRRPPACRLPPASPRLQAMTCARSPSDFASSSQRRRARARQHHGRALRVQRPRDRAADAARSAGHQRRLAREIEHAQTPLEEEFTTKSQRTRRKIQPQMHTDKHRWGEPVTGRVQCRRCCFLARLRRAGFLELWQRSIVSYTHSTHLCLSVCICGSNLTAHFVFFVTLW